MKTKVTHVFRNDEEYNSLYGQNEDMNAIGDEMNAAGQTVMSKQFVGKVNSYILTITNSSGAAIDNVNFLNAARNYPLSGNGLASGIAITNGYSGETYQDVLADLMDSDIEIKGWDILSSTDAQAEATITFTTRSGRGISNSTTIVPDRDPKNYQTGRTYSDLPVTLTKNTTAVLDTLGAGLSVRIKMFLGERTTKTGVVQQFSTPTLMSLPTK